MACVKGRVIPCLLLSLLMACMTLSAQASITVQQLSEFVRTSIRDKHDDRKVADYIKKGIKLSDKLDAATVEDLQGAGAGPQTVAALKGLMSVSAALPPPPPPAPKPVYVGPPPPDSVEQKAILARVTDNALNYSKNLPDFICLQLTSRYIDNSGLDNFRLIDTVGERLSYVDQKEDYKVVQVNHVPVTSVKHETLGGATSSGEFGTMMREIFSPETETHFEWDRWATLRGKRMYVFSYKVEQSRSKYSILHVESARSIVSGYHGEIYADRDTSMVMRIKMEADTIPTDFPIQSVSQDLNYDYQPISGHTFLLPYKAELHSREGRVLVKNVTEFRLYNKFSAESTIDFGDAADPVPDKGDDKVALPPAK